MRSAPSRDAPGPWSYPYRWVDDETLLKGDAGGAIAPWSREKVASELLTLLEGKRIVFNGSSLVRELYRAFNELLAGAAKRCFFPFQAKGMQQCEHAGPGGGIVHVAYIHRPRPWAQDFAPTLRECASAKKGTNKKKSSTKCAIAERILSADVFVTSPEGLHGSQLSEAEQDAVVLKDAAAGLDAAFGPPGEGRRAEMLIVETTIAGEGGVASVMQNAERMQAFNARVRKLALAQRATLVRVFEASRAIMGASYDNVHMCPQCCTEEGASDDFTRSRWPTDAAATAELMGCHMKVDVLAQGMKQAMA